MATRPAEFGTANVLLRGHGRQHFVKDFPGPLSVKCVIRGEGHWRTEEGIFRMDERSLLVVNEQQPYSLTIDSREPVRTCCLFFASGFVESVYRAVTRPVEECLADPFRVPEAMRFLVRLEPGDGELLRHIRAIDRAVGQGCGSESWRESQFLAAARSLIALDERSRARMARVPGAKASTRTEIYLRLLRAQEFLHAHLDQPVSVAAAARTACLSLYHFHRLFTEAFHQTPHQYLTCLRLDRAAHLLASTELPVTEICLQSGFSSLGSFSSLFRRRHGSSPREFRNRKFGEVPEVDSL